MKKITLGLFALVAALFVSCAANGGNKIFDAYQDATNKVEEAGSSEELTGIADSLDKQIEIIIVEVDDPEVSDKMLKEAEEVAKQYNEALEKKKKEFTPIGVIIKMYLDATEKVKVATTEGDVRSIVLKAGQEAAKYGRKVSKQDRSYRPTAEERKEHTEVYRALEAAADARCAELRK